MADEKTPKKEAKRVKVKVAKEGLTHKGKECKVGDIIEVTDWQADWLKKSGRVEQISAGKPASL